MLSGDQIAPGFQIRFQRRSALALDLLGGDEIAVAFRTVLGFSERFVGGLEFSLRVFELRYVFHGEGEEDLRRGHEDAQSEDYHAGEKTTQKLVQSKVLKGFCGSWP